LPENWVPLRQCIIIAFQLNKIADSARLSGGAGCSRLVSKWFGWFKNKKNILNQNKFIHRKKTKRNKNNYGEIERTTHTKNT
jgi:hypothetical protein